MTQSVNKLTKLIFITNILFWFGIAINFAFFRFIGHEGYLLIKVLLFFEPILFGAALYGLLNRVKWIYLLAIVFTFGNVLLSVTDEIGLFDLVSLILSVSACTALLMYWKWVMKD